MDYEDMDRKLKEHKIHAAVFCSPHNPSGRVWERWEIEKAMELSTVPMTVYVISDEIWSDLTLGRTSSHSDPVGLSMDAKEHVVATVRAFQDVQSGRSDRQLTTSFTINVSA